MRSGKRKATSNKYKSIKEGYRLKVKRRNRKRGSDRTDREIGNKRIIKESKKERKEKRDFRKYKKKET